MTKERPEAEFESASMRQREDAHLRRLNTAVTGAIFKAERLQVGTPEASDAFGEVCRLEMDIALRTSPDTLEGGVARRGAVTAALSAQAYVFAIHIIRRYLVLEPCPPELAKQLLELLIEATDLLTGAIASLGKLPKRGQTS